MQPLWSSTLLLTQLLTQPLNLALAIPPLEPSLLSSSTLAWGAAGAFALIAAILLALWLRTRDALTSAAKAFSAVSDNATDATTLPKTGAFAATERDFNKALNRLRASQTTADLHDQALATLEPERILEAAARFGESVIAVDGLDCASITCVRFYRNRGALAQSHSRLEDGSRDLVILNMPDHIDWPEASSTAIRVSAAEDLPDYLSNLERPFSAGGIAHLDVIPLRAPRDAAVNREVMGVLAIGRKSLDAAPLRFDEAPQTLALSRSIAHALGTCERKLASERLASDSLIALARAADATSTYTRGHSERVAQLAVRLGKQLALLPSELERLRRAALLHDLGSVAISQRLLDQKEAYDEEHRALMRPHIELGLEVLEPLSSFADVRDVILHHHEWWNGEGYPQGIEGEQIDPLARILTVVDVYEALTSTRPYRRALEPDRALAQLQEKSGSQFEPRVIEALTEILQ